MVKLNKSKKAMEMSINIIIMLVIGLTIMGLIIGFITSFLGKAEDSFNGKLTEDDKAKIDQVNKKAGNFEFLTSTVTVVQGSKVPGKLYVKLRNPTGNTVTITGGDITSTNDFKVDFSDGMVDSTGTSTGIRVYSPPVSLEPGASEGFSLEVYAEPTVSLGTYYATFTVNIDSEVYTSIVTLKVK